MDTAQWPQGIAIKSMGVVEVSESSRPILEEKRGRPLIKDQALNCPRCNSTTTKFCYYNNYSLSQPRYFCKACKRYWTEGGSLRNVPVGGASRKNKRSSSSSSYSSPSSSSKIKLAHHHDLDSQSPNKDTQQEQGQDLNLAYPPTSDYGHHRIFNPSSSSPHALSAMEMIKINGINASRGLMSSFMNPISLEGSNINHGFSNLQQFNKPISLSFSLDGYENSGYGSRQGVDTSHDQDLTQMPSSTYYYY